MEGGFSIIKILDICPQEHEHELRLNSNFSIFWPFCLREKKN